MKKPEATSFPVLLSAPLLILAILWTLQCSEWRASLAHSSCFALSRRSGDEALCFMLLCTVKERKNEKPAFPLGSRGFVLAV